MPTGHTQDETRYPDKLQQAKNLVQLMQSDLLWYAAKLTRDDIHSREMWFRKVRRARSFSKLIDAADAYFDYAKQHDRPAYERMTAHMGAFRLVLDDVRTKEARRLAELANLKPANDAAPTAPAPAAPQVFAASPDVGVTPQEAADTF